MELSVFTALFGNKTLIEMAKYLNRTGIKSIEMAAGGYPGDNHCKPKEFLKDKSKLNEFMKILKEYDIKINALSCHGNPVHPNSEIASKAHEEFMDAVRLANILEVKTVVTFSGCPGDSKGSKNPNWVTCSWPTDFSNILKYQWEEELIPYWQKTCKEVNELGINKIALEMHPGFCVYNPETLLRLRKVAGETIGANFDPSHLFWQGMDPVIAIRSLKGAIYHFHAKDTKIDDYRTKTNGVLDTKNYDDEEGRSWVFRTVGYGHSESVWKDMISELKVNGYDGAISIEHEDGFMSVEEGFEKAVSFLNQIIIKENPSEVWWI